MKYTLKIIFGTEQVSKIYNNEPLTDDELKYNLKEYLFANEAEKLAFINGINEAIGWTDCFIPEFELLKDSSEKYTSLKIHSVF